MKFCLDDEECRRLGITMSDALYLASVYFEYPFDSKSISKLMLKGLLVFKGLDENKFPKDVNITQEGINLIESVILNSEYRTPTEDRYDKLAEELQALYPKGRKPGTNCTWRDSKPIIAKRLKTLAKKYNVNFTNEEAIEATKRYIDYFKGDYTYMQVLKYFISKQDRKTGEEVSPLLSFIENKEDVVLSDDWTTELV